MRLNAVNILGISIINSPKKEVLEEIQRGLTVPVQKSIKTGNIAGKIITVFTPNAEQLVHARKNPAFASVLNQADIAIPDSAGIVWADKILSSSGAKHSNSVIPAPIPGVEFMEDMVSFAAKRHVPIGLIGGRDNLAVETLHCLQKTYSGLSGWAENGPEVTTGKSGLDFKDIDEKNYFSVLASKIEHEDTHMVFVALGPPKQEYFILQLKLELSKIKHYPIVLMAVGGSFDVVSGRLPRAPVLFRKPGLEWLWRLILQPWRIFRQLALVEFIWMVVTEKFRRDQ